MKLVKNKRIWRIVSVIFLTVTILLLYFTNRPPTYTGNVRGGINDEFYKINIETLKITSYKKSDNQLLEEYEGREVIFYSSKFEMNHSEMSKLDWLENKKELHQINMILELDEKKLPFTFDEIEQVKLLIDSEYRMYEADDSFFGKYDPKQKTLVGEDGKPLILLLNYDLFSFKNNWKVLSSLNF